MLEHVIILQLNSGMGVKANLQAVDEWLARLVAEYGPSLLQQSLVVLPENFAVMGVTPEQRYAVAETPSHGVIQDWLATRAEQHQCYMVGGTVPLRLSDQIAPRVAASCLVYAPSGELLARYDKRHMFDARVSDSESYCESAGFVAGDDIVTCTIEGTIVGLSICYDMRFPEHFRNTKPQPDLWLVPSAFAHSTGQMHWQTLLRARAIENQCHVVGVNQCGEHPDGRQTWGHSQAFNDWGESLAILADKPGYAIVECDFARQQQRRKTFPVLQHRRDFSNI